MPIDIRVDYNTERKKYIITTTRKGDKVSVWSHTYEGVLGEIATNFMAREGLDPGYELEISDSARAIMREPEIRLLENLVELQNQRLQKQAQRAAK